jgi:proteasome lid subunit RPN8/RPN11
MLVLTAALADLLRHYGRCALPREAVGIDEKEFLAALRGRGTEPEAFFHTHPVEPAIPSTHDILGAAGWPRTPHVILSFDDRAEFRAWRIIDGQALPEPIRIV